MENSNYFGILLAPVRYDKELLPNEKLLFVEITALTRYTGECWASNSYLADLLGVSIKSISTWINHLKERGHINVTYKYRSDSKEIEKRIITINYLINNCQNKPKYSF